MTRVRAEIARKAVHVGTGGFALLLRWLPWPAAALLALSAVLFNLFVLHRLTGRILLRDGERERSVSCGIVLYPVAVLLLILVFPNRLDLAAAAWGLLAFGDGMATVAGLALGRARLPWNREKSWCGFAAFIVAGAAASTALQEWVRPTSSWKTTLGGCLAAAIAAALIESMPTGVDDNITVPVVGGCVLYAASLVDPVLLSGATEQTVRNLRWGLPVNVVLAALAYSGRVVGASGAVCGTVMGTVLFAFVGWSGFAVFVAFFVVGTVATRLGWEQKVARGVEQEAGGRRGAKHALANMLAGITFGFLSLANPDVAGFVLAFVAAFATAAADTVSSEIGQAYGRRAYLLTTLRAVLPGTDGAVSLEGTAAGILASAVLGSVAWGVGLISGTDVALVVIAAFIGTTVESYLGAAFRGESGVANELVNFANTVVGGTSALVLHRMVAS